jgi:hypothetical protein
MQRGPIRQPGAARNRTNNNRSWNQRRQGFCVASNLSGVAGGLSNHYGSDNKSGSGLVRTHGILFVLLLRSRRSVSYWQRCAEVMSQLLAPRSRLPRRHMLKLCQMPAQHEVGLKHETDNLRFAIEAIDLTFPGSRGSSKERRNTSLKKMGLVRS